MYPFVLVFLDEHGYLEAKDEDALGKILGAKFSLRCFRGATGIKRWVNIHTNDEDVIRRAEDHFAGQVLAIVRSWE